ncbi:unnamed protein product, partial [Meganyctiphanes norvegica]
MDNNHIEGITIGGDKLLIKTLSPSMDENPPEEETIILNPPDEETIIIKPLSPKLSEVDPEPEETLILRPLSRNVSEDKDCSETVFKIWQDFSSSPSATLNQTPDGEKQKVSHEAKSEVSQEAKQEAFASCLEAIQESSELMNNNDPPTDESRKENGASQNKVVRKKNVRTEAKGVSTSTITMQTSSRRAIRMPKRFADSIVELEGLPIKTEPPDSSEVSVYDMGLSMKPSAMRKRQKVSHTSQKDPLEIEDPQLEQVLAVAEFQDLKSLSDIKTERKIIGYMCSDCRKIYRTGNGLKLHKCEALEKPDKNCAIKTEDDQQGKKKMGPSKGIYECPTCHVQFRDNHVLSRHLQ